MKATLILLLTLLAPCVEAAAAKATPAPSAAKGASKTAPADPGWPREITKNGIKLVYYQPQIDEWKDYRSLKARIAFMLTQKDSKPVVGIADLEGATTANVENRTVLIRDLKIAAARFPTLPEAEVAPMEALLKQTFPGRSLTVSLDRLAAGVERTKDAAKPLDLKMDPPPISISTTPAILLMVEGKPVPAPIEGTKLQFIVNTNWDLFFDPPDAAYYLLTDKAWLTASALDGEWSLAAKLPGDFAKLPKGDNWDHVKKAVPARVAKGMVVPKVIYSEKPAELVTFNGNPVWEKVEGTRLLWGRNTEDWVFQDGQDSQYYFLVSGRWFRAPKFEGPWSYAGNDLPEDFKLIPTDSPCSDVLASVPGTPEAADAVLLAEVPTEAVIKKAEAQAKAKVAYDGEPAFQPVEGTTMTYATNTSSDVVKVENNYYLCQDAVWFESAAPVGPWVICLRVPPVIYTIPPAYPIHRVTYVKVEAGETDDVVVCSYTAGYFGAYVAGVATGAALVWGTGYYYPPYVAWGGAVPIYRPWPATYGFGAAYNPWTGGYAVGGRVYGPYASAGRAAWYNPATGTYGRAARVSGPYGTRTVAAGYNPRTDTGFATRQNYNGYAQWGSSAVRRGDDWVRAGHVVTDEGGAARWRGSEGGGRVWKTDDHSGGAGWHDGNFYAGKDGNVYRRDDDGNWAKYDDGDWNSVDRKDARNEAANRLDNRQGERPNTNANVPDRPGNPVRPGENGAGERFHPGENKRPGQDGGGQRVNPGDVKRPGQDGGGQRINPGEVKRPGQDGGGQRINPGEVKRPGQDGGGQRVNPGAVKRPGSDGGGQRVNRDAFENRQPTKRAPAQPSEDVMNRLNRESANRQRGSHNVQQHQSFQRSSAPSSFHSPGGSRQFHGGGGGHGGGGRGGGGRHR